ncbi:MAG: hypothetical protein IKO61_12295 [Lachnospiraceae bacterium]|nr:hypothetical protein [Lachnospiraceae bacterium]
MGNNLFSVMWNAIKARFTRIVTKIRMFTRPDYIKTRVIEKIRQFFQRLFDVKPRDKDDYYGFFGWLVSKKLAFAIVIIVGVLSFVYVYITYPSLFPGRKSDHIKTYSYNSILLKFASGTVRIKGKSGYLAYEGEVSKGYCNGQGTLYNPQGNIVYQGEFEKSKYENQGTFYYPDGTLHYTGTFHENLFSGTGTLYRNNGSMEYEGDFLLGMKEGNGKLYDMGKNNIFTGSFTQDEIRYSELIGKSSQEIATAYTGDVVMYDTGIDRVRFMRDIEALTLETASDESVEDEYTADKVYVLKNSIRFGGQDYTSIDALVKVLGNPTYEGVARAILPEIIAINSINESREAFGGPVEVTTDDLYKEYVQVTDYNRNYEIYLVSFKKEGLEYNFVTMPGRDTFEFYYILTEDMSDLAK